MTERRIALALGLLAAIGLLGSLAVPGAWRTPDQRALRAFERGDFARAAAQFTDQLWRGVALYRAGEFETAAGVFAGIDTADGALNRGNALVFQGKYDDAIKSYDRALEARPDWPAARSNRAIAVARRLDPQGGAGTGGKLAADAIVFDEGGGASGDEVDVAEGEPMSGAELNALWLRNVQTEPADFLRLKFAYQLSKRAGEGDGG